MTHSHNHSHSEIHSDHEMKTLIVIIVTAITMVAEIIFGYITHSMALLADGWHMGTHAFALLITYFAYVFTKKFKDSHLFPLGTGKISSLAAFTSSIFLGITAVFIIKESIVRLFHPLTIAFSEAILVAVIGLIVNLVCLFIMEYKSSHTHKDYNFKAAYLHILTDAFTSILAIIALVLGKYFHFYKLDPIIGIVGGIIILKWAFGLVKNTSKILLDMENHHMSKHVKEHLENNNIEVFEISIWNASENTYCLSCKIKNSENLNITELKNQISNHHHFEMMNIEVLD